MDREWVVFCRDRIHPSGMEWVLFTTHDWDMSFLRNWSLMHCASLYESGLGREISVHQPLGVLKWVQLIFFSFFSFLGAKLYTLKIPHGESWGPWSYAVNQPIPGQRCNVIDWRACFYLDLPVDLNLIPKKQMRKQMSKWKKTI